MSQSPFPFLSTLILLPMVGSLAVALMGRSQPSSIKITAFLVSLANLAVAAGLLFSYRTGAETMQYVERVPWVPALGISYFVGGDGISLLLVATTAFLTPIAIGAAWKEMGEKAKEYSIFLLLMEAGMIGAFVAQDLALFFLFWEVMLLPMVLLIGICGAERRIYAAIKFFLYTAFGSLVMLLAIIGLAVMYHGQNGQYSFDLYQLATMRIPGEAAMWLFLAFALAFAIKVPVFPLHAWLPDAYTQAPTAVLVLATMLVKVGSYGFLRFGLTLFPQQMAAAAPAFMALAVVGVVYAGLIAVIQKDIVRLVAYSSIAHMAFVVLGIFSLNPQGMAGATLQMVNHSLSTGGLFILAAMVYERTRTTAIAGMGGLAGRWPVLGTIFTLVLFSSAGLPGLNGFIGEFLILAGTFQVQPAAAAIAATGVVLAAVYLVWMFQRTMHSEDRGSGAGPGDMTPRELAVMVPMVVMIVWIGLFPTTFLSKMESSVGKLAAQAGGIVEAAPDGNQLGMLHGILVDR